MTEPDDDPPGPVLSPLFWAAMLFCLLCFGAAAFVTLTALRHPSHPAVVRAGRPGGDGG